MAKKKAKKSTLSAAGRQKMVVTDSAGVKYTVTNIQPKARVSARTSKFVNFGAKEKAAPLPTSCHYSRNAAKNAAETLRARKVKARVVTSGKCKKGTSI